MEQRLANTWRMTLIEKKFIEAALLSDLRIDGRGPFEYRNMTIQFGSEDGSSEVQLGQTRVMGFVTSQLVQPYRDRPNEGSFAIFTEFSPMADPSFEVGRPGELAVELGRIVDRGLRESRAVDTESLCVAAGKWAWSIHIDLHILDNGGNLVDAANIAALAALLTFRRPECTLAGDDGQEVIIHPPEMREPLPLIVHHLPIAVTFAFIGSESRVVIDPSHLEEAVSGGKLTATLNTNGDICAIQKAGGADVIQSMIMQCLRIAVQRAADITDKIKKAVELYNTERALKKIKHRPDSVNVGVINISKETEKRKMEIKDGSDDMESEIHSSEDRSTVQHNKLKPFIGGPSRWDPYSKGVNADELKASLASRSVFPCRDPYSKGVNADELKASLASRGVFPCRDPYSKGVNADELKASLASRAVATPNQKTDISPLVKPELTTTDQPIKNADPGPSSQNTGGAGEQTEKPKTLMDAVKPKHKRKMKNLSNTEEAKISAIAYC